MSCVDDDHLLQLMTGKNLVLYPFQRRMIQTIRTGKNVLVLAPTGSGKTWGAVLPFIQSLLEATPIADRVLYALPLRTLASDLYTNTAKAVRRLASLKEATDCWKLRPIAVSLQTGEQQDDPFFEADVCFTTIDQLMSAYLNIPVSLGPRLANINAGALVGALVVFDEIHLLDAEHARATMLEMTARLKHCTQFVLMTATLGEDAARLIAGRLDAEIISVSQEELPLMASHRDKSKRYVWVGKPMSAREIAGCHMRFLAANGTARTLVICNTVARAQEMYRELPGALPGSTKLELLHSRFTRADRANAEAVLGPYFGPEAYLGNVVLVTTQVVEAGVDISADEVHTELCPGNSMIQRAGRCARYAEPRNRGIVRVYALQTTSNGEPRLGPYREKYDIDAMKRAAEILGSLPAEGRNWDYADERDFIEQVHGLKESSITAAIISRQQEWADHVAYVMDSGDRSATRDLIRSVDSVTVFVSDRPQALKLAERPCLVSVPRVSLGSLERMNGILGWVPVEPETEDDGDFRWVEVRSVDQLTSSWMTCLSPAVAAYDPIIGLSLGIPGSPQAIEYRGREGRQPFSYWAESYTEHVRCMLTRLARIDEDVLVAARCLGAFYDLSPDQVRWLVAMTCVLHDSGKLTKRWQEVARQWQQDRHPEVPIDAGTLLAHTTVIPEVDSTHQRNSQYRFPPHAVEGAVMVVEALYRTFAALGWTQETADGVVRTVATAISRHHSPRADKPRVPVVSTEGALAEVNMLLSRLRPSIQLDALAILGSRSDAQSFADDCTVSCARDPDLMPLYWHIVRIVRLADQKSFGEKEVNQRGEEAVECS